MNLVVSAKTQQLPRVTAKGISSRDASSAVNLYQQIPSCELSLEDFEEYALERLKLLRKLEQLSNRHVPLSQWKTFLDPMLKPFRKDPEMDNVSHFILRLAYSRTEDFRRWFLTHETMLLKYRMGINGTSASSNHTKALASIVPEAVPCSKKEVEALWSLLWAATPTLNENNTASQQPQHSQTIYAVPFEKALDLVATRQVLVRKGKAYIPQSKLVSLVVAKFRSNLSRELALLANAPLNSAAGETQRVHALLSNIATTGAKDDFDETNIGPTANLSPGTVKENTRHMPLCMVQMQWGLEQDHKLKYWARQQYGLFLKGAGLSMEDALIYFERMFTTTSEFSKQYGYNIRHMYGKEGKRKSYTASNCSKIILDNGPNSNEHHGCPYKHRTVAHVQAMLSKLGVSDASDRAAIRAEQESKQYQLACLKHFQVSHKQPVQNVNMDNLGNHPNAWFQASVGYAQEVSGSSGAAVETGTAATVTTPATTVSPNPTQVNEESVIPVSP